MRSPNSEQKLAIEHNGGVLLRAGAGSGKTFVLVEHIVYLAKQWIQAKGNSLNFEEFVRSELSQIVMMTFTNKAAGEMSIRLNERFKGLANNENDSRWKIILESLPLLTVTTIDGFCRRLIVNGFFPGLSSEAKVIFTMERVEQVRTLFEKWLSQSKLAKSEIELLLKERKNLMLAFSNIFSDPELRLLWKETDLKQLAPENLGKILEHSFHINGLEEQLLQIHSLDLPDENERSAFEKVVGMFQQSGLPIVDTVEKLKCYHDLFSTIKVLRGESGKKKSIQHELAKEALVRLRDWLKKWYPVIVDYISNYESKITPWINICFNIFNFIDLHLDPNSGLTFGDIEYHVAKGLKDPEAVSRIKKRYHYFIVDEFQDTSNLQFRIIRDLIGDNFNSLFCVGDAKQAIYGFRGGELGVFQSCSEMIPKVLELKNNYRSVPAVIEFNNLLFKAILPLGEGFSGLDAFTVLAEDQAVPAEVVHDFDGEVNLINVTLERDIEELGKFSTDEINQLEANYLVSALKKQKQMTPKEVSTVLYRKLRPSTDLIRLLIKEEVGFTAQFKIEPSEDPILGLFLVLLKHKFDSKENTKNDFAVFMLKNYLGILGIKREITHFEISQFHRDITYWGLLGAFIKFLSALGITAENSDLNLDFIKTLCELHTEDPESILSEILNFEGSKLSLDFRYGQEASKIQIMTAHASKGLEFENVFLGGIYTNGKENPDRDMFGDEPASFLWYLNQERKERQKSPQYLLEAEIGKLKNFSESKRLFYVACTRAKKRLYWVNFLKIVDLFSVPSNSWVNGINYWVQQTSFEKLRIIEAETLNLNLEKNADLPLFFYDSVGVHEKINHHQTNLSHVGILSELSVTRLNSLIDCPRKFYLENILKLKVTKEKNVQRTNFESEEGEEVTVRSSSERGSLIHQEIAYAVEHNFILSREFFNDPISKPIHWILEELKKFSHLILISEKPFKFKLFNFMISGIPDLIIQDQALQPIEVWDFKTGKITKDKLDHYWSQLMAYAYGLYVTSEISKDNSIELKLSFVDEERILNQKVDFVKVETELFKHWLNINHPEKINPDHCSRCPYGDICPR
jgi:ATP-dependent exoDNAse (exonuclease V) beta subunit